MKTKKDIILVIPVGPDSNVDFVLDTIYSFQEYTACSYQIIVIDDSQQQIGKLIKEKMPHIEVSYNKKKMGGWAGLYISLAEAYKYALDNYEFKAILKLDTDALIIGPDPEKEALQLFSNNPLIGIAGQYPNDYYGNPWDIAWPRQRILNATRSWKFIRRPVANWLLMREYRRALSNNYKTGESVFGGAYFMNYLLSKKLDENALLPDYRFRNLNLGEDHLFGCLAKASAFELASLSGKSQSFACAWKGLPASPEELHVSGKKIIHSVRHYKYLTESEIRRFFRDKRKAYRNEKTNE